MSSFNTTDYINTKEALSLMGMEFLNYGTATRALNLLDIPSKKVSTGARVDRLYSVFGINNKLSDIESFYNTYCVIDETGFSKTLLDNNNIKTYPMPKGYNPVLYKKRLGDIEYKAYKVVYKRDDIKTLKNTLNTVKDIKKEYSNGKYISLEQALDLTRYNQRHFAALRKSEGLTEKKIQSKSLFIKDEILYLIDKRNKFLTEYIDCATIRDEYLNGLDHYLLTKDLEVYPVPAYAVTKDNAVSIGLAKGIYKRSDVLKAIEEKLLSKINYDLIGSTPMETFNLRLNSVASWEGFEQSSQYTKKYWYDYVSKNLLSTSSKGSVLEGIVNKMVRSTITLKKMLTSSQKGEIYDLTSNEINLFNRGVDTYGVRWHIYCFAREVYNDFVANNATKHISYKSAKLEKPMSIKEDTDDEQSGDIIYDFKVYSDVFKYQLNIDLHITKSLDEIKQKGTCIYASTWLYVMLHLNNAWRNGDVLEFLVIDIDDIILNSNIDTIEWFRLNKLSLPSARGIIQRVRQWEFQVSKTQMKGRFFCSDELAPALATAIAILTIFNQQHSITTGCTLMQFNTKNNRIYRTTLSVFFAELKCSDFKFSSRKFNKTIMSYVSFLANLSGDNKALEYAKWMRSHNNISSTLHYIDFDIEGINELSEMLFQRGEFGYVTSLLLSRLNSGDVDDFKETTKKIVAVNNLFGEATKLNYTVGFMNTIRADRDSVVKYISEMGFSECQELLTDLFARKLPSKEDVDVQCLCHGSGCLRIDLKSCFECQYHIPSIYALSTLCESIMADFKKYYETSLKPVRYKVALSLHRKKMVLSEAVSKYGREYVFNCLGLSKDEFVDMLSEIDNPLEIEK